MSSVQSLGEPGNLLSGNDFLKSDQDGVICLPSGLKYKVFRSGKGASPSATSNVSVHYAGRLLNETIFDSSYKRGSPATFGVDEVIPGWTEILQKMKVGDCWQVFIPSKLAYGSRGAGGVIGPNSDLVFVVELLGVRS
jgi:FKBP-type peptidyl-prolyl cis-trans isomerase FklB